MVAFRLLHVYLSVNVSIQECVFHIQLDDRMLPDSSYSQQHSCCGVITHRGEDLVEILPFNLSKAFGYEACFELVKAAISIGLHFENPFYPYGFLACWELCEFPGASFHQCVHLSVHRFFPLGSVGSFECFSHCARFWWKLS